MLPLQEEVAAWGLCGAGPEQRSHGGHPVARPGKEWGWHVTQRLWKSPCEMCERRESNCDPGVTLEVGSWESWPWCGTGAVGTCMGLGLPLTAEEKLEHVM